MGNGLRLRPVHPTSQPIQLDSYEPLLLFRVRAAADGAVVAVEQPLDIPVQPTTLTVPASGSVELVTPIRSRSRAGAPPSSGRFVWSFDQPCQAQVAPGSR